MKALAATGCVLLAVIAGLLAWPYVADWWQERRMSELYPL
jgi:hypothetical protein